MCCQFHIFPSRVLPCLSSWVPSVAQLMTLRCVCVSSSVLLRGGVLMSDVSYAVRWLAAIAPPVLSLACIVVS